MIEETLREESERLMELLAHEEDVEAEWERRDRESEMEGQDFTHEPKGAPNA